MVNNKRTTNKKKKISKKALNKIKHYCVGTLGVLCTERRKKKVEPIGVAWCTHTLWVVGVVVAWCNL